MCATDDLMCANIHCSSRKIEFTFYSNQLFKIMREFIKTNIFMQDLKCTLTLITKVCSNKDHSRHVGQCYDEGQGPG